nr:myrosinase 1-like [Onthophagus taurus]XP_022915423.1 myrosinase 1-like [Onthophagus taurus]XP_022915431.1 myrosinase 1-like [Onthophagus taurus]XP_022915440.1 myrosinase 1-like [Onthophagus taurus]XP_022915449.1 myrosinase 1-like [Onthophagus taurus]XP_022915458.1 myrosinase 1-like [Onthophagus taurus]
MKHLLILIITNSLVFGELQFPSNFKFGVATSAYQVEGAWNLSGKGENIWDYAVHRTPNVIQDGTNGDIACDTYHHTEGDVQLLKQLGVNFYRISLSWSRILPTGFKNKINPDGIRYYNELLDALTANGIEPMVSLFHWDLPQPLQDLGGWTNPLMADYFLEYVRIAYENFGDRVKYWITFNEPSVLCAGSYEGGLLALAPFLKSRGVGLYLCGHTLLIAHAKAYHLYDKEFRKSQKGKIGISLQGIWYEPSSSSKENVQAANQRLQMEFGWFAHPIFSKKGDYPPIMKERISFMSKQENFAQSRLPEFTPAEISYIRGTSDYFGFNHYTSAYAVPANISGGPSQDSDFGSSLSQDPLWEAGASWWIRSVPWGFGNILKWIKNEYGNPEVIITENGFSDKGGLQDCRRINYHYKYLEALLNAIHNEGCNISGYTAWSFMDNFEWTGGYSKKFGLIRVDFESPERTRTLKMSAYAYRNIIETKKIDWSFTPSGFEKCVF